MKTAMKSPDSTDYRHGLGFFLTETPPTDEPKHLFRPLFPRNPLFPALRSGPKGYFRGLPPKQIPSSQWFLSHGLWLFDKIERQGLVNQPEGKWGGAI
jgi:hypothetical protein